MNRATSHHVHRRRDRGSFRVVPQEAANGEPLYAVVGPTGVALYTFTDMREAIAEAAELNTQGSSEHGSLRMDGRR